jgi:hypothetical protein
MKKSTTRSLLFVLLLAVSIGAYAFLNVASYNLGSQTEAQQEQQLHEQEEATLVLPDVRLIKKVVEHGKRLLPAS